MDRRGISSASQPTSYHFQLLPLHLKVEHSFAKALKPNTAYRLSILKGIQQMSKFAQPIKAKLVGGKIIFDPNPLSFSLPLYNPARNLEFTVKLLETKPNQNQQQIASHRIKSGDFVRKFKDDKVSCSREEATLADNLSLVYDLFVHNSKPELEKIVQEKSKNSQMANKGPKTPRKNQVSSEINSQSDQLSESGSVNRDGLSSKRRLARKRGHGGKLKSKQGSRDNSVCSSHSGRSSHKSFGPFPHTRKDQHFMHSPKKVSPPKVDDLDIKQGSGKKQNLVTIGRKESQRSEVKNRGGARVNTPTKNQSEVERSQSQKKKKIVRNTGVSPKRQAPVRKDGRGKHDLQLKTDQNMFDIDRRTRQQMKNVAEEKYGSEKKDKNGGRAEKRPPLPNKGTRKEQQLDDIENQPISKPTDSRQKQQVAQAELSVKSRESKARMPIISVRDRAIVASNVNSSEQTGLKTSIRLSILRLDQDVQESAGKEYNGMKDRIFYILFTVVSLVLFWNAITPTSKV